MSKQDQVIVQSVSWDEVAQQYDFALLDRRNLSVFDQGTDLLIHPVQPHPSQQRLLENKAIFEDAIRTVFGHQDVVVTFCDNLTYPHHRWFLMASVKVSHQSYVMKVDVGLGVIDEILINQRVWEYLSAQQLSPYDSVLAINRSHGDLLLQVMDQVPGDAVKEFSQLQGSQLDQVAQMLATIHKVQGKNFGIISIEQSTSSQLVGIHSSWCDHLMINLEAHLSLIEESGLITSAVSRNMFALFRQNERIFALDQASLLHGDCSPGNFLWVGNKLDTMIDWGNALLGDPLYEMAMLAFRRPTQFDQMLKYYNPDFDRNDPDVRFLYLHYMLRYSIYWGSLHDDPQIRHWIIEIYGHIVKFEP